MIRLTLSTFRHFFNCSQQHCCRWRRVFLSVCQQVVVQYDKDLLEVWDEAKRLRCEWFNDYEKTASKPPMVIADLDVIQLDFRGENERKRRKKNSHQFSNCWNFFLRWQCWLLDGNSTRERSMGATCQWHSTVGVNFNPCRSYQRFPRFECF